MLIIHDKRLPAGHKEALDRRFPAATLLPFGGIGPSGEPVYESISGHPDIYFFQLDENTIIHAPSLSEDILEPLNVHGIELVPGEDDPGGRYPCTARYNASRVGDTVFHNLKYTDPVILERIGKKGLIPVNVAQGYTRCSILKVGDKALITSDGNIADQARRRGIDVLLMPEGNITLPGERYGFIGGAGGMTPEGTVVVLGEVAGHPAAAEIKAFFEKHETGYIELEGLDLYDAGSILIFGK